MLFLACLAASASATVLTFGVFNEDTISPMPGIYGDRTAAAEMGIGTLSKGNGWTQNMAALSETMRL